MENKLYNISYSSESGQWGSAVNDTWENEDGTLWVSNGEYSSQVNYCPMTGYKAKKQIDYKWEDDGKETTTG